MSQFLDEARIFVKSGKGGNGWISFRREKFVSQGGPDGGDGGRGGNVIFIANPKINTLRSFAHKVHYVAEDGNHGERQKRTGASAADLEIDVPVGTIVREEATGKVVADLVTAGQRVVIVKGGRGGRGNPHWVNSRNQAPTVAEKGEPGQQKWLLLELKLLADVGIIGMPNAGKSTLLSVISNARPQIADYPFTTLTPHLGVVTLGYRDAIFADIPGLIEGAHKGAGLGHAFLRHIQRTRLLIHLLDGSAENPIADFHQINTELSLFDDRLGERKQIVVVNKMDIPEAQAAYEKIEQEIGKLGYTVMSMSGATQKNTQALVNRVFQTLDELPPREELFPVEETPSYEMQSDDKEFTVEKVGSGIYRVHGERIERTVAMTYWDYDDAVRRFQRILETLGISKVLEEKGIEAGDKVIIGQTELEWGEQID